MHARHSYDAIAVVHDLLTWAERMGGWEAPCWRRAEALMKKTPTLPPAGGRPLSKPCPVALAAKQPSRRTTGATFSWNAAAIAKLRVLWSRGDSTSAIGHALGVSKNGVIGKAHRLYLDPRPSPIRPGQTRDAPRHRRTDRPKRRSDIAVAPLLSQPSATIAAAAHKAAAAPVPQGEAHILTCRWPMGEPGTLAFHFCEASIVPGHPYCEAHCRRAYARKRKAAEEIAANISGEFPR